VDSVIVYDFALAKARPSTANENTTLLNIVKSPKLFFVFVSRLRYTF